MMRPSTSCRSYTGALALSSTIINVGRESKTPLPPPPRQGTPGGTSPSPSTDTQGCRPNNELEPKTPPKNERKGNKKPTCNGVPVSTMRPALV
jgi:hypothetical protein